MLRTIPDPTGWPENFGFQRSEVENFYESDGLPLSWIHRGTRTATGPRGPDRFSSCQRCRTIEGLHPGIYDGVRWSDPTCSLEDRFPPEGGFWFGLIALTRVIPPELHRGSFMRRLVDANPVSNQVLILSVGGRKFQSGGFSSMNPRVVSSPEPSLQCWKSN